MSALEYSHEAVMEDAQEQKEEQNKKKTRIISRRRKKAVRKNKGEKKTEPREGGLKQ